MKVLVMRHADRDRATGVPEREQALTETGRRRARAVVTQIKDRLRDDAFTAILSSPFRPALDTAHVVRQMFQIEYTSWEALAPAPEGDLQGVVEELAKFDSDAIVLLVGHNPQLQNLVKRLASTSVRLDRSSACCIEVHSFDTPGQVLWEAHPTESTSDSTTRLRIDRKDVMGLFFFLMALVTFVVGLGLLLAAVSPLLSNGGAGSITVSIEGVLKADGVNAQAMLFLAGFALMLTPLGFVRKAYQEAIEKESGPKDTIRHMSPYW